MAMDTIGGYNTNRETLLSGEKRMLQWLKNYIMVNLIYVTRNRTQTILQFTLFPVLII